MRKKRPSPEQFEHEIEKDCEPYLIAKKEFVICQNGYFREIKEGEDISDVPAIYYDNLKTEKVI